jgi:hypothetical protein
MAANVGWKGRMIAPATMTALPVREPIGPAQSPSQGEQHTGGDRVHAAGNAEEPTIQFSTDFLIRLQQPQGADAMSTTATAEADRQEVDPPIRGRRSRGRRPASSIAG